MSPGLSTRLAELPRPSLPFGAHALVWGDVDGVRDGLVTDSQAQVSYGAHPVLLHQDVL